MLVRDVREVISILVPTTEQKLDANLIHECSSVLVLQRIGRLPATSRVGRVTCSSAPPSVLTGVSVLSFVICRLGCDLEVGVSSVYFSGL